MKIEKAVVFVAHGNKTTTFFEMQSIYKARSPYWAAWGFASFTIRLAFTAIAVRTTCIRMPRRPRLYCEVATVWCDSNAFEYALPFVTIELMIRHS
jgi:hypothetical protein